MLGAFDTATYEMVVYPLQPGDRLVLYTDGITEAANDKVRSLAASVCVRRAMRRCCRMRASQT